MITILIYLGLWPWASEENFPEWGDFLDFVFEGDEPNSILTLRSNHPGRNEACDSSFLTIRFKKSSKNRLFQSTQNGLKPLIQFLKLPFLHHFGRSVILKLRETPIFCPSSDKIVNALERA